MKYKPQTSTLVLIGIFLGILIGYYLGISYHGHNDQNINNEIHDHTSNTQMHAHEEIQTTTPSNVSFEITKDAKSGYNLKITTKNFNFSPENASLEHVEGQGHAHLYIDGEKIQRVYGNWIHLDNLDEGEHTIQITLNSNDHSELIFNNKKIQQTKNLLVE